jgi:hypothetical protein
MSRQGTKTPRIWWLEPVIQSLPIPAFLGALASWRFTVSLCREPWMMRIPNAIALAIPL